MRKENRLLERSTIPSGLLFTLLALSVQRHVERSLMHVVKSLLILQSTAKSVLIAALFIIIGARKLK